MIPALLSALAIHQFFFAASVFGYWWMDANLSRPADSYFIADCFGKNLCSKQQLNGQVFDLLSSHLTEQEDNDYFDTSSRESKVLYERSLSTFPLCYCDQECFVYGDCCPGLESRAKKDPHWNCLPLTVNKFSPKSHKEEISVYMIGSCPRRTDDALKSKCLREKRSYDYSYIMDVPVLSLSTNKMYVNIFCAECHSDAQDLMPWMLNVECFESNEEPSILSHGLVSELVESDDAIYMPGERHWTFNISTVKCELSIKEFEDPLLFIQKAKARRCIQSINSCPSPSENSKKCESYSAYVTKDGAVFKNEHCAKCHNVQDTRCHEISYEAINNSERYYRSYSYDIKMDFKPRKWCSVNEIYDPVRKKCQVFCRGGRIERNETCFRKTEHESPSSPCQNLDESPELPNVSRVVKDHERTGVLHCTDPPGHPQSFTTLSNVIYSISSICLFIFFGIYRKKHTGNLIGKSAFSLSVSLCINNLLFIIHINLTEMIGFVFCAVVGALMQWASLAASFWLTVIIFHAWKGIASPETTIAFGQQAFVKYSLLAWVSPCLLVGVAVFYSHLFDSAISLSYCWLGNKTAFVLCFIIPISVLLILDAVFIMRTHRELKQMKRRSKQTIVLSPLSENERANPMSGSKSQAYFNILGFLSCLMGLAWLFAFLSVMGEFHSLWYFFAVLNGLQGVFIFVAHYCNSL